MTDIEISEQCNIKPISLIAEAAGIPSEYIEQYGRYKCKVNNIKYANKGKLILVSAMNPTPLGEGKTTVTIGLSDALRRMGKRAIAALREPSLGPVFGLKGGATGGGYSQVIPMADINLHFTGDLHAITSANNLLSAAIDNHIYQGNALQINPERIIWKRCLDINDRNLRNIVTGLGRNVDGLKMNSGFTITAASEIMAILCLSEGIDDLIDKLANITIGYNIEGNPVRCKDLKVHNAMAILLMEAIKPNLVQTLEGTPVFIHGGPFANIAHGCNSIIATRAALSYGEYCITEAGFGADLGMEKFINLKCRTADLIPNAIVLVATVKALKYHGGVLKENLNKENIKAVKAGFNNLRKHIENARDVFNVPSVVAINRYSTDTDEEIAVIKRLCLDVGISAEEVLSYSLGGEGAVGLAEKVIELSNRENSLRYAYENNDTIEEKLMKLSTRVYGGKGVNYSDEALLEIEKLKESGMDRLPVIVAKTQYSLSDDPKLLNRPEDFNLYVREIHLKSGAGFIVAVAGDVMLMPGLPQLPSYERMSIDKSGIIRGLS